MRHLKFTGVGISENFKSMITQGPAFQFDMEDIARIRGEIGTLINKISEVYLPMKEKQEEKSKQAVKSSEGEMQHDDYRVPSSAKSDTPSDSSARKNNPFVDDEAKDDCSSSDHHDEDDDDDDDDDDSFIINNTDYLDQSVPKPTDNDVKIYNISSQLSKAILDVETALAAGSTGEHIKHLQSTASLLRGIKTQLVELVDVCFPDSNDTPYAMECEENTDKEQEQNNVQKGCEKEQMDKGYAEQEQNNDKGDAEDGERTAKHSAHHGVENCQPPVKKQENSKKENMKGDLKKVQPSALVEELKGILGDELGDPDSSEYVMCQLSIAQCLTDLVNSCFCPEKEDSLCLKPLQDGLAFLIQAMSPHVQAMNTFVVEPRVQQDARIVSALKNKETAIGAILGSIDVTSDLSKANIDVSCKEKLVKVQKAIYNHNRSTLEEQKAENIRSTSMGDRSDNDSAWLAKYEDEKADHSSKLEESTILHKKIGYTILKKYLTIGIQTKNMLLHCLHILLMDRVITKLELCHAICHWSISESKDLCSELKRVADVVYAHRKDPPPDGIDKMTIKTILKQIILPAIMLEKKSDGNEGEEKPIWKIATKIMISIFSGLVGHDARVKTEGGASVKKLFEDHTLSIMKVAEEKTVSGSVGVGEDIASYCCGDEQKHKDRRRRITSIYLMLLLRKSMERALTSCDERIPLFDVGNEYFGSYSGTILRLSPTEVYANTTFIDKNYFLNNIDDENKSSTNKLLNYVKGKGNFEKKHLLITSQIDLDGLKNLAECAYPTGA